MVEHGVVMRRAMVVWAAAMLLVAGCGSSSNHDGGDNTCEVGEWVSTSMVVPTQAALGAVVPTGGGDGIAIRLDPDGGFLADFGPMQPALSSFESGGQIGALSVRWSGVGSGHWSVDDAGHIFATVDDLGTVRAAASFTLGTTAPPIFDATLQELGESMMLDDTGLGVFTVTDCTQTSLRMTTPFPGGTVTIDADR